ncbi:aldehyde dehydrogenase family protein [Mesorhizobium sp.]|uniref:aldehyde dehydrogenase family protein n=1 Tax=Mesorhizobium sp. TaxID=1871066 RepID=UPI00345B1DD0
MASNDVVKNYIDGEWRDSVSGTRIEVDDPASAETIAVVAEAGPQDIELAVTAAHRVFRDRVLIDMHPYDRGRMLFRVADALEARFDEIAAINCAETEGIGTCRWRGSDRHQIPAVLWWLGRQT